MGALPASATRDVSFSQVTTICFDALHANWDLPYDATRPLTAEEAFKFDRLFLGKYAIQPSVAEAQGYRVYGGSIRVTKRGICKINNKLVADTVKWQKRNRVGWANLSGTGIPGLTRVHLPDLPPGTTFEPPREELSACGRFVRNSGVPSW